MPIGTVAHFTRPGEADVDKRFDMVDVDDGRFSDGSPLEAAGLQSYGKFKMPIGHQRAAYSGRGICRWQMAYRKSD